MITGSLSYILESFPTPAGNNGTGWQVDKPCPYSYEKK